MKNQKKMINDDKGSAEKPIVITKDFFLDGMDGIKKLIENNSNGYLIDL